MTIAQLIEALCQLVCEMSTLINHLSERLMQSGIPAEGEMEEISDIRKRIRVLGITAENNKGVD